MAPMIAEKPNIDSIDNLKVKNTKYIIAKNVKIRMLILKVLIISLELFFFVLNRNFKKIITTF